MPGNAVRIARMIFTICVVLFLFTTRFTWKTTNDVAEDVYQQQGIPKTHKKKNIIESWSARLISYNEASFLHVVVQFPLISNGSACLTQRQLEYLQTLKINLAHPLVKKVHILCENDQTTEFIEKNFTLNAEKIVLKNIGRRMRYSDALAYASSTLLFETCVIMNADCYIGKGFEYLNTKVLKGGTIYALTRHERIEQVMACGVKDFCGANSKYIGSHDAFVMNLVHPLPDEILRRIDYIPNIIGIENVVISVLKIYGGFRLRNPCHILQIIHNHCNRKRGNRRTHGQRLEKYLKLPKGLARFSRL